MAIMSVARGGQTYALFVSGEPAIDGAQFLTNDLEEFQVGLFERPAKYEVKPHAHPEIERTVRRQSEFLMVQRGAISVTVFDEDWQKMRTEELREGDCVVFFRGGHSITVLKPARLIEVKQGPYPGDGKAKVLSPFI